MSRTAARRWLWLAAILLVPLPYFGIAHGAVPVLRFAWLGGISGAYAGLVNGGGVAWMMVALLWAHALVYALLGWCAAALLARALPARARTPVVATALLIGFVSACLFPIYHTPFASQSAWTTWPGLLR